MNIQYSSMIFVLSLAVVGCGKSGPKVEGYTDRGSHWEITGPLSGAVDEIAKSDNSGSCDRAFQQMRVELASAVDARAELINSNPESSLGQGQKLLPFHGSYLLETQLGSPSSKEWQKQYSSWQNLYRIYKMNPGNEKPAYWSWMNTQVRGILMDDIRRVVDGTNLGIQREDLELLPKLKAALNECVSDKTCVDPKLSGEMQDFSDRVSIYANFNTDIEAAKSDQAKRDLISDYAHRVKRDEYFHSNKALDNVTTIKTNGGLDIQVPFVATGFSETDKTIFANNVESRWKNEKLKVSVKFVDQMKGAFSLLFEDKPGSRPYVGRPDNEMHLFPYNSTTSIAHEFGHVLGFDDHYYTYWDWQNCVYSDTYREDDIMSVSRTGSVLPEEFKWLETAYPAK